jgi:hypothetical protein
MDKVVILTPRNGYWSEGDKPGLTMPKSLWMSCVQAGTVLGVGEVQFSIVAPDDGLRLARALKQVIDNPQLVGHLGMAEQSELSEGKELVLELVELLNTRCGLEVTEGMPHDHVSMDRHTRTKPAPPACHRALQMPPLMGASKPASYQKFRPEHPCTTSAILQARSCASVGLLSSSFGPSADSPSVTARERPDCLTGRAGRMPMGALAAFEPLGASSALAFSG